MMGEEAGWFRDPAPANPAAPTTLRFWDGRQWTAQVRPASKRQRLAWQAEDAEQRRASAMEQAELQAQQLTQQLAQQLAQQHRQGGVQVAAPALVVEVSRDFTPDGEPLAGWGRRYSARVVDGAVLWVLWLAFGWHFLSMMVSGYTAVLTRMMDDRQAGRPSPPADSLAQQLMSAVAPGLIGFVVVVLVVRFVYEVGFLKGFQATPGKMVLGLQVRLRSRPGPLPWRAVLLRWFSQFGYGLLAVIPFVSYVTSVYWLMDYLWPLWDGKRQALHDKAAATNVVYLR